MALYASTNKTYVHVSIKSHVIVEDKHLIDVDVSANIVSDSFRRSTRTFYIKYQNVLKLKSTNKQPARLERVILSHLQVGNLRIRMQFNVADNQALVPFLRISSTKKYI